MIYHVRRCDTPAQAPALFQQVGKTLTGGRVGSALNCGSVGPLLSWDGDIVCGRGDASHTDGGEAGVIKDIYTGDGGRGGCDVGEGSCGRGDGFTMVSV